MINKFIHIFDDDKFIDITIDLFEKVIPNQSTYYVNKKDNNYRYVKSNLVSNIELSNEQNILNFSKTLNDSPKVVLIHAIDGSKQSLISKLDTKHTVVWFVWGYDIYNNFKFLEGDTFLPLTRAYFNKSKTFLVKVIEAIFNHSLSLKYIEYLSLIERVLGDNLVTRTINELYPINYFRTIKKIDFVVPVVEPEMKIIKKLGINPQFAPFTYGSIEQLTAGISEFSLKDQKNILVGNSASLSSNHLDTFEQLAKIKLDNRLIITPLNYGDKGDYLKLVKENGETLFGESFVPLIEFKPLVEYNKIIKSCGIAIFNHVRQQAVGNILATCYLGAKVFLNEKSPVYEHFKNLGIIIFGMNELSQLEINKSLTDSQIASNKKLLWEYYSEEAVLKKISKSIDLFVNFEK